MGRGRDRVSPAVDELPIKNISINENPPSQHEQMYVNEEFKEVEEIGQVGGVPDANACISLSGLVLAQQIMSFLKGFAGLGTLPSFQALANPPIVVHVPKSGKIGGNDAFFRSLFGSVMIGNDHDMLIKCLKLKTPIFHGSETEDAYEIIIEYYERLYKLGIVLSLCPSNFKENPSNGGGHTWNAGILLYPRLLRPNFMLCS